MEDVTKSRKDVKENLNYAFKTKFITWRICTVTNSVLEATIQ